MLDPGAEISGFILPSTVGPTEENVERASISVVEPTPITPFLSPGERTEPQAEPEFPMANTGIIPTECQVAIAPSNLSRIKC